MRPRLAGRRVKSPCQQRPDWSWPTPATEPHPPTTSPPASALFELTDAVLCTDGPVRSLVDLALAPEHRRGHGSLYAGLNRGRVDVARLQRVLAGVPLPRAADGRLVLAVDVSPWLRPDAGTVPDRSFCHTYGRGNAKHQMMPGWPYSVVVALESGRTSWCSRPPGRRHGTGHRRPIRGGAERGE